MLQLDEQNAHLQVAILRAREMLSKRILRKHDQFGTGKPVYMSYSVFVVY